MESKNNNFAEETNSGVAFRKPSFIGSKKCLKVKTKEASVKNKPAALPSSSNCKANIEPLDNSAPQRDNTSQPLPYKEPVWSGLPVSNGKPYIFEVLKNGAIIDTVNLMDKSFWVFGRLPNCDICMQHPTISRYHAILQYRSVSTEKDNSGFYIYDLESTHGTFLNTKANKLKARIYTRVQVGHILRLGCSQRSYILTGPDDDQEEESKLSVTELKQLKEEKIKQQKEEYENAKRLEEDRRKKEDERGVDWGLGEDADESVDVTENPYAQTNNEELYLDDPKKALRGFFEREGFDLEYECTEQGMGQFLCKVELPLDDDTGRPIMVEVLHRGKKKEAVIQCALEACRTLDRYGVLRKASHESRKRKSKNWEENDYYDSDDDTFLDRTGTVEKKREMRMMAKVPQKAETYESLLQKENNIRTAIAEKEGFLTVAQEKEDSTINQENEEDSLDTYMKRLSEPKLDKQKISKIKLDLASLRREHTNVIRLLNLAKPAAIPSFLQSGSDSRSKYTFPVVGKQPKKQLRLPKELETSKSLDQVDPNQDEEREEESEPVATLNQSICSKEGNCEKDHGLQDLGDQSDDVKEIAEPVPQIQEEFGSKNEKLPDAFLHYLSHLFRLVQSDGDILLLKSTINTNSETEEDGDLSYLMRTNPVIMFYAHFKHILNNSASLLSKEHKARLDINVDMLKYLVSSELSTEIDWKTLLSKKRKICKLISRIKDDADDSKLQFQIMSELEKAIEEVEDYREKNRHVLEELRRIRIDFVDILGSESRKRSPIGEASSSNLNKKQKKAELEKQRGYKEDSTRENYSMWVPPNNQSGDGRTSLNEKYGY
ncbi:kanadaptin [Cylas formicarius]|uniref:kanadaptin n=1 Tax=Cylas formicarius TaxID=197179 RepID=UPI0029584716|nr:kanadaptin [Cylas formicarius]